MRNEALLISGSLLNSFTHALRDALSKSGNKPILVRMRNGTWCEVIHLAADAKEGHPYESEQVPDGAFTSPDGYRYWHADGRSLTSRDFDLIAHNLSV